MCMTLKKRYPFFIKKALCGIPCMLIYLVPMPYVEVSEPYPVIGETVCAFFYRFVCDIELFEIKKLRYGKTGKPVKLWCVSYKILLQSKFVIPFYVNYFSLW